jgi:hypothetical protein
MVAVRLLPRGRVVRRSEFEGDKGDEIIATERAGHGLSFP